MPENSTSQNSTVSTKEDESLNLLSGRYCPSLCEVAAFPGASRNFCTLTSSSLVEMSDNRTALGRYFFKEEECRKSVMHTDYYLMNSEGERRCIEVEGCSWEPNIRVCKVSETWLFLEIALNGVVPMNSASNNHSMVVNSTQSSPATPLVFPSSSSCGALRSVMDFEARCRAIQDEESCSSVEDSQCSWVSQSVGCRADSGFIVAHVLSLSEFDSRGREATYRNTLCASISDEDACLSFSGAACEWHPTSNHCALTFFELLRIWGGDTCPWLIPLRNQDFCSRLASPDLCEAGEEAQGEGEGVESMFPPWRQRARLSGLRSCYWADLEGRCLPSEAATQIDLLVALESSGDEIEMLPLGSGSIEKEEVRGGAVVEQYDEILTAQVFCESIDSASHCFHTCFNERPLPSSLTSARETSYTDGLHANAVLLTFVVIMSLFRLF